MVQPALGAGKIALVHTVRFKLDMIVKHAYLNGGLEGKIRGARRPKSVQKRSRTYAPAKFRCHFEERSFEPRALGDRLWARPDACARA